MKVAIAHDFLVQYGGAERVLEVLCEMFPGSPVFTLFYDEGRTRGRFRGAEVRTSFLARVPVAGRHIGFHHHLFFWSFPAAMGRFDFSGFDLVISSSASYSKGVVLPPDVPHICYCYTPTRYLWDDVRKYVKGALAAAPVRAFGELLFHRMRRWDVAAARRPTRLIAVSNYIAGRIRRTYGRDPDGVVFPPVDVSSFAANGTPRRDYLLMVGRMLPYKRFDLGIAACNALRLPLKVVGIGRELPALRAMAGPTVEFLGWVDDRRLADLYRGARALIFPQVEDFGLVAAEALAAGTPVVAYRDGGALDLVEEGVNGLFFDRQEAGAVATALEELSRHAFDEELVRQTARRFDRSRFVEQFSAVVRSAV